MAAQQAGAVPICGEDGRLKGTLTDRDVVRSVVAADADADQVRAGEFAHGDGQTVTIGADDDAAEALRTMSSHQVRRLPVIDDDQLVGVVSLADLAHAVPQADTGELVAALSVDPA